MTPRWHGPPTIWASGQRAASTTSVDLATAHADEFAITEIDQVERMITNHHKLRPAHDHITETFRIADRIDVSRALLRGPIRRSQLKAVVDELPYLGFHTFLARGLVRHAARHPTRPLPMLRW